MYRSRGRDDSLGAVVVAFGLYALLFAFGAACYGQGALSSIKVELVVLRSLSVRLRIGSRPPARVDKNVIGNNRKRCSHLNGRGGSTQRIDPCTDESE